MTPLPAALVEACSRFLARFTAAGPAWEALLDRGMAVDFDWRRRREPVCRHRLRVDTPTAAALVDACSRFLARFTAAGPAWGALLDRGMAVDFDWRTASAPAYVEAYGRAVAIRRAGA